MNRARQPWLIHLATPLTDRLGPGFPGEVPDRPGVYFFRDTQGTLLYIGQSSNLRQRLASYRHVREDRHPRRILRLVGRIARVDWRLCESKFAARELERALLLEYRPPFNRAGVWQGSPWWFQTESNERILRLGIAREAGSDEATGPLPPSFRQVFASLSRCAARIAHPDRGLWEHPAGLFSPSPPLNWEWSLTSPGDLETLLQSFVSGRSRELLDRLEGLPPHGSARAQEQSFWEAELERLRRFADLIPPSQHGATARRSTGCAK